MDKTTVGVWLDDPVTKRFFAWVDEQREWSDTEARRGIREPGQPYLTAENHARCDGSVDACNWIGSVRDKEELAHIECFYPEEIDE